MPNSSSRVDPSPRLRPVREVSEEEAEGGGCTDKLTENLPYISLCVSLLQVIFFTYICKTINYNGSSNGGVQKACWASSSSKNKLPIVKNRHAKGNINVSLVFRNTFMFAVISNVV